MNVEESTVTPVELEFLNTLDEGLAGIGLELPSGAAASLYRHFLLLTDWNARVNLTGIVGPVEAAIKHYVDSLSILRAFTPQEEDHVIDVGSGAGFPGIPLKLARLDLHVSLLESNGKKAAFLREACHELGIGDSRVLNARAEEAARDPGLREKYDVGVGRAVAELRVLCEYVLPFIRTGGVFLAQKGPDLDRESVEAEQALRELGGELEQLERFELPRGMGSRCVAVIRKVRPMDPRYPRRTGVPEKKPL